LPENLREDFFKKFFKIKKIPVKNFFNQILILQNKTFCRFISILFVAHNFLYSIFSDTGLAKLVFSAKIAYGFSLGFLGLVRSFLDVPKNHGFPIFIRFTGGCFQNDCRFNELGKGRWTLALV